MKKLKKAGWSVSRQKVSHVMMVKSGYLWTLSVPQHKELGQGLLRNILKQAELDVEEFNTL
ncbi:MAG TPA: type II toxin-antitoxin system HicA family toxin [bacterium]|nr:type II toxin-antitoxin system HicA family toxin [bacterium]